MSTIRKAIPVNLEPVKKFNYNQIPNHEFCLVLLGSKNQALHTPFMCKDYLQDILWSEFTGRDADAYGLTWKKGTVKIQKPRHKIALLGGEVELVDKVQFLEKILNTFEVAQGFKKSRVHPTDNPKIIVVDFSNEWFACGPLISAFTTIIRISGSYLGEDVVEFLDKLEALRSSSMLGNKLPAPEYSHVDIARLPQTLRKLKALLAGKHVELDWSVSKTPMHAHNNGISS